MNQSASHTDKRTLENWLEYMAARRAKAADCYAVVPSKRLLSELEFCNSEIASTKSKLDSLRQRRERA